MAGKIIQLIFSAGVIIMGISLSTGIPLGVGGKEVKLNGTAIGSINNNKALTFSVAKRKTC
ncbi:MAG: hypothetical protein LBD47_07625 [Treponema sp.]|jgi:hypothetical protein|nr:hypothetical protein [Treponema sp.]